MCMYVRIYTLVMCMCVCMCVCVCVCVCIYIYVCMRITHYDAFKILNPATHNKKHYHRLTIKTNKKTTSKCINKLYDSVLTQLSVVTNIP